MPHFLYKYRHIETDNPAPEARATIHKRAGDLLVRGRIWVAAATTLNDLHDMRFNVVQSKDPAEIDAWIERNHALLQRLSAGERAGIVQRLRRHKWTPQEIANFLAEMESTMGVFSASQDPRNEPMWAHYSADHRGYCVQFDTTQDGVFLLAQKARYSDVFPTITLPRDPTHDNTETYLHKSSAWAYEREWRLVTPQSEYAIQLRPEAVTGVILGVRATQNTRQAITLFNNERESAGLPRFRVYQAAQHRDRYGMRILCAPPL